MLSVSDLPALNAFLNGSCALFLCSGFVLIRIGKKEAHRFCMVAAFLLSVGFLSSYLTYHALHGSTPFPGTGWSRPIYFSLLVSHIVLAVSVLPLSLITLYQAVRGNFRRHRRIARWTLPIWLYVSFTGVAIYWILYHMY